MIWSASVLSAASSDTEPTIIVTFDSAKYIFNVGECTGRTFMEGRRGWKNTKAMFLTSVGTQRASGLPGMFMLLADASFKKIDVVGPRGLAHWLASMRTYVYRAGMQVRVREIETPLAVTVAEPQPVYQDQLLTVYGISLLPEAPGEDHIVTAEELDTEPQSLPNKRKRTPSPPALTKKQRIDDSEDATPPSAGETDLLQRSRTPDFMPFHLRGEDAKQWRQIVIDSMFPCTDGTSETASDNKVKAKSGKAATSGSQNVPAMSGTSVNTKSRPTSRNDLLPARSKGRRLPPVSEGQVSHRYCYVCVGPRTRGKFDIQKATQLGIPKGPIRGKLTRGDTVTFMVDDGKGNKIERTVRPEEVVSPSEAPRVVIIIDITSIDQIPQLTSHFTKSAFYRQFRSKNSQDKEAYVVSTVFHLCGEDVLEDSRYKEFMNGFADTVNHVVSSRKHVPDLITFGSAAYNQLRLNQLDPYMFPIQTFRKEPVKPLTEVTGLPPNTFALQAGLHTDIRPSRQPVLEDLIESHEIFHTVASSATPLELPSSTLSAFDKVKARYAELQGNVESVPKPGDDVVVVPLGTSSALPNKYRNVSSTLIQIPRCGNILLDCGEGTWGQLTRLFGDDPACSTGVWQALRDLKCIYLSHIHGDHHIGLAKILAMRKKLNPPPSDPLYVIGVRNVLLYLREMSDIEDLALDALGGQGVITILSDTLNWRRPAPYPDATTMDLEPWTNWDLSRAATGDMCRSLGLTSFTTVDVSHGTRCYGAVLRHSDGWSIVFSADTLPTSNLVYAGQNATLLIHEATMADDQEELAKAKLHSTFSQAVDVGRRMKAENILLTHFSARYPKMPQSEAAPLTTNATDADSVSHPRTPNVESDPKPTLSSRSHAEPTLALAFDHMRIRIGDMRKINTYLPAIEQSFIETLEAGDEDPDPAQEPW